MAETPIDEVGLAGLTVARQELGARVPYLRAFQPSADLTDPR